MKFVIGIGAALAFTTLSVPAGAQSWVDQVSRQISSTQSYPRSAIIREEEGVVKIRVLVSGDGSISNVELIEASGSKILDREALKMPSKAGKVMPPPGGRNQAVDIPVRFKLS